jgi:hypothetical protein
LKRSVLILAMLAACSSFALGQAIPGATRALDIQVGGSFTYAFPDYTPQKAMGYGIYGTFDFTPHWGAEVDFHSISIQQHSPAKETTFEYGARYHRTYGRYNPFLRGGAGRGTFDSAPTFFQAGAAPAYNMLSFEGGADIEITSRFSVRGGAIYQRWFTAGVTGPANSGGPGTNILLPHGLTPILYEAGISYHITGGTKIQ